MHLWVSVTRLVLVFMCRFVSYANDVCPVCMQMVSPYSQTYFDIYIHTSQTHMRMYMPAMRQQTDTYTHTYTCAQSGPQTYTYTYTYTHIHMHTYRSAMRQQTDTYTYTHTYTCALTYTYTHTHARTGPPCTGKLETMRGLSVVMGKCFYILHLTSGMHHECIGDMFKGVGSCGAWGYIYGINTLPVELLAVCANQMHAILQGIRALAPDFSIMGQTLPLQHSAAMFVASTLSDITRASSDSRAFSDSSRQRDSLLERKWGHTNVLTSPPVLPILPQNLRSLLRPATVVDPDPALICHYLLVSMGFTEADLLAARLAQLYKFCKDILTPQPHYDWSLRGMRSVLDTVALVKSRVAGRRGGQIKYSGAEFETVVVIAAVREVNDGRLRDEDRTMFEELIRDIFTPDDEVDDDRKGNMTQIQTALKSSRHGKLTNLLTQACKHLRLSAREEFVVKCVQLDESLTHRHTVFLLGPSGVGKTCMWRALAGAMAMQVCVSVCVCVCACAVFVLGPLGYLFMYIYIYTYIYMYMHQRPHTHTHTRRATR